MEFYRIFFAEFEKLKGDKDFVCFSVGAKKMTYKTKDECVKAMYEEFIYIKHRLRYEKIEEDIGDTEFKLKCTIKGEMKQIIHHYKMVRFST